MRIRAARATRAALGSDEVMAPLEFEMRVLETALIALEQSARNMACGADDDVELVGRLLAFLQHGLRDSLTARGCALLGPDSVGRGESLLRILSSTLRQLDSSSVARRQFFHAARGFIAVQRGQLGTLREALPGMPAEELRFEGADCGRQQVELEEALEVSLQLLGRRGLGLFPEPTRDA